MRIRVSRGRACLTVKGITENATRAEFEDPLPVSDATAMLENLCRRPLIEKRRYRVDYGGMTWEIDEFLGENTGLVVAGIALATPQQPFEKPPRAGEEVTSDPRYYNASPGACPFSCWENTPRCG